jgi:hypothetical protein
VSHSPGARPGVEVTQEFVVEAPALESPQLPAIAIGIARQLEEDLNAGEYDARTGAANDAVGANFVATYPDLKPGAVVDAATVVVSVQNALGVFPIDAADVLENTPSATEFTVVLDLDFEHTVASAGTTGSFNNTATFTDTGKRFISLGVLAGDQIKITSGTLAATTINVVTVSSQTVLVTDFAGPFFIESNIQYTITRTEKAYGTILVDYHATRSDLNDELVTIEDDDAIEDLVGPDHPDNPAGFAVSKMRLNAQDRRVYFTGVNADTTAEHTRALEFLESQEVYGMVPLSQNTGVLALYKPHAVTASLPENKHERVVWLNRELVLRETRIALTAGRTGTFTFATAKFTDSVGAFNFASIGVLPGDFVVIDDAGTIRELLIQTVGPTVNEVTINVAGSVNYPGGNLVAVAYQILGETKSKTEQASYLATYAASFAEKRVRVTWPDQVEADVGGVPTIVPGYYLSAGAAAMRTGVDPQQPLTNLSVSGFSRLLNSNKYFSEAQLKTLSNGGMFIFEQTIDSASPYVRQQRTTDTSELKKNEDSIVAIADHVSKFMRQELQPYIGRYNITPEYIEMIKVVINGLTERLKQSTSAGPEILDGQLVSIEQDPVDLDHLIIVYRIEAPVPANFIRVTLRV